MKQQSAVLTALLSIATVAAMTIPTTYLVKDRALKQANVEMRDLAKTMAQRLDREMFERYREISNIASLRSLGTRLSEDAAESRILLEQLQGTLPSYAWIGFVTPEGIVRASTKGMLENVSVAERPWFQAGLKEPAALDVHEAKLLAEMLGPSADGQPFRFVDVTAPVFDEAGTLKGVLGAHLSWSWANDVRTQLLSTLDPALETDLLVTMAEGSVILGGEFGSRGLTSEQIELTAATPRNFDVALNGRDHILSATPTHGADSYPGLGWRVVAHRPKDVALADANRIAFTIIGIGLLAALGSAIMAYLIASRVTRPIVQLSECAERIGRGTSGLLFDRQRGSFDVLHLSSALRSLSRRLDFAEHAASVAREDTERSVQALSKEAERHHEIVETLRLLADTDPLTELLNRRSFLKQAIDVLAFFRRYGSRFAILVIDIDHFKDVNDTHGHAAGDEVIKAVAKVLADAARQTDRVGRLGGEEFVVLLREIDASTVEVWAERVRQAIDAMTVPADGTKIHVTVSIGATTARSSDRDVEDIIRRADDALYLAKNTGRNRTTIAETDPVTAKAA